MSKNSLYQIEIIKNESFLKKSSKSITTYYNICECELLFLTNFFSYSLNNFKQISIINKYIVLSFSISFILKKVFFLS